MAGKRTIKRKKPQKTTSYTPAKWERAFLSALRQFGVVSNACSAAKIDRRDVYRRRDTYPVFAVAWADALDEFADSLEAEAVRRARDGIEKGIYVQGLLMATELQYSDTLMTQLLKAKRPDQYGDKLTLKIEPSWLAKLKQHGLTPMQAMEQLINALDEVDADNGS